MASPVCYSFLHDSRSRGKLLLISVPARSGLLPSEHGICAQKGHEKPFSSDLTVNSVSQPQIVDTSRRC